MGLSHSQNLPAEELGEKSLKTMEQLRKSPPKEKNLILDKLLPEHWERIFDLILADSKHGLLPFLMTSKRCRDQVLNYAAHFVHKKGRLNRLRHLLLSDGDFPLLIEEKALRLKLHKLDQAEKLTLIHLKAVFRLNLLEGEMKRCPVYLADDFPHLGNPNYIFTEFDEPLNRDIVNLKDVCWLYFNKEFSIEHPGQYQFSIRMRLRPNLRWPHFRWHHHQGANVTTFKVTRDEDILVSQDIDAKWWPMIKSKQFDAPEALTDATLNYERNSDWFSLRLRPVFIAEASAVKFHLRDIDNPGWKSGMQWDFIQLIRI